MRLKKESTPTKYKTDSNGVFVIISMLLHYVLHIILVSLSLYQEMTYLQSCIHKLTDIAICKPWVMGIDYQSVLC